MQGEEGSVSNKGYKVGPDNLNPEHEGTQECLERESLLGYLSTDIWKLMKNKDKLKHRIWQ